ncbi:MAG: winged helix-turn-helix domain-containing protein [Acidobacteriota bacterium]
MSRSLGPKGMGVLLALVEAGGEPVSKDALIARAWDGDVASDEALTTVVYELRKALDDDARRPRLVGTVRGRGYRLLTSIEDEAPPLAEIAAGASAPDAHAATSDTGEARRPPLSPPSIGGTVAMLLFALLLLLGVGRCFGGDAERPADVGSERSTAPVEIERESAEQPSALAEPLAEIRSITIMPFEAAGDAVDRDAFADGLAERLAIDLARGGDTFGALPLDIVPAFSRAVVGTPLATGLGTDALVEGSVRRAGDRLWVAVQLVDTRSYRLVWGGTWEREIDDAFGLQDELAKAIGQQIRARLRTAKPPS